MNNRPVGGHSSQTQSHSIDMMMIIIIIKYIIAYVIRNNSFEKVEKFTYLGTKVTEKNTFKKQRAN
jgi:hypothetical protein